MPATTTTTAPRVALYARCSTTNGQDPETQLRELRQYVERRGWTAAVEYVDAGVSGAKDRRPALDRLMADARRRRIDVVLCWALDRFGRSLRHLVTAIDELGHLGVGFVAITQGIDTSGGAANPASTLQLQVLAAVAQFERSMIQARVRSGIAKARAQGKRIGRPRAALDLDLARRLLAADEPIRAVARALGTNPRTLRRALERDQGEAEPPPHRASA